MGNYSGNNLQVLVNGAVKSTDTDYFDTAVWSASGHGIQWGYINSDANSTWDYDDLYVDYTLARVEICAESTWPTKSHCEIQIPTSWSTSLGIAVNTGTFATDDTAYLYVVNSAGEVNANGHAITIGGVSTETASTASGSFSRY